jgi:hypothetical protein
VPVVASRPVCVRVCVGLGERRPMRMRMSVVAVVVAVIRGRVGRRSAGPDEPLALWCEIGTGHASGRCNAGSRLKGGLVDTGTGTGTVTGS